MNRIVCTSHLSQRFPWLSLTAGVTFSLFTLLTASPALAAPGQPAIQFNRDIRPILGDNCIACHGPDPGARKADLRLDTKDGLYNSTPKRGPAVVPGDIVKSELWRRITTTDPDDVMPPPKSHKELKPEQKELLKRWIVDGAPWQAHWSFIKPQKEPLPAVKNTAWVRNPIDTFVLAKLESQGIRPAPEADRRTLARRLSLDLTGLPPAPDDVEKFVNDRSSEAYEKYLQKLLLSPHWGEHRARYWLDAARYADTHGLHFDNYREMWPYRDYVIRAFNRNLPFNQFITEQIAGDLLPNPTEDQLVATGFHRCNITTNEGGTIEDENLANYANDRVTTTGWVFLGLTTNCGACHDHKFDPFTTRDFYSMAAFFRNTTQSGFDRNQREGDVFMTVPQTEADKVRWKALPPELEAARKARDTEQKTSDATFTNWVKNVKAETLITNITFAQEYLNLPLTQEVGKRFAGEVNGHKKDFKSAIDFNWRKDGPIGNAPILGKDKTLSLGDLGDFDANEPFSLGAWVWLPKDYKGEGSILARMSSDKDNYRGWDFFVKDEEFGIYLVNRWPTIALKVSTKDKAVKRGEWHHLYVTYNGSMRAEGLKLFVDGVEAQVNREKDRLEGSIHMAVPLRVGQRDYGNALNGGAVQDVRIVRRRLEPGEVRALAVAPRVTQWLGKVELTGTNAAPREAMRAYYRVTQDRDWQQDTEKLSALETEQEMIRGRNPVTHVQREKMDSEPMAYVLFRGQYDKPKDKVTAATPVALHPLPKGAPLNRLGLAEWLVSPENPLTARVIVNRFWQEIFGTGIVRTTEDFGVMGEAPSNQALLDWLAVEFQESGWDAEHMITLMVTSAAYRQSAGVTPEKLEKDPQNRLLSRGPRFRMDAEMLRDCMLAASGLMNPAIGGPSVKPYQPPGVWEAVAMPESNTRYYEQDHGRALYRRSLYTFWKRAAPPASMDILNAPSRETCTVRRERTDTPLQALVTLNDTQFMEASRKLAELALTQSHGRKEKSLEIITTRLMARTLNAQERPIVLSTLKQMEAYYNQNPDAAKKLLAVGESKSSDKLAPAELAALTMVANQLMNLDEVLNK